MIPEEQERILLEIGRWLATNCEAIYGTSPWRIYGEGPTKVEGGSFKDTARKAFTSEDIRFATKGNTLYAIVLAWPGNGRVTIRSLAGDDRKIRSVHLLGSTAQVKWTRNSEGLMIETAGQKSAGYASALKID
jgi:alpha-L-fucosidase